MFSIEEETKRKCISVQNLTECEKELYFAQKKEQQLISKNVRNIERNIQNERYENLHGKIKNKDDLKNKISNTIKDERNNDIVKNIVVIIVIILIILEGIVLVKVKPTREDIVNFFLSDNEKSYDTKKD